MTLSARTRFEVLKRDGFRCVYCGRSASVVDLEVDHIEPKSNGGADNISNYASACRECNGGKSNMPVLPTEAAAPESPPAAEMLAHRGLIGKCFVIMVPQLEGPPEPERQGIVRAHLGGGAYLVQFFSYLSGEPTTMQIFTLDAMSSDKIAGDISADKIIKGKMNNHWLFFEDDEALRVWHLRYDRQERDRRRRPEVQDG